MNNTRVYIIITHKKEVQNNLRFNFQIHVKITNFTKTYVVNTPCITFEKHLV